MNKRILKIAVTGGHHTPALAVIDDLSNRLSGSLYGVRFYWIGHRWSMWGDRSDSAEYQEVTGRGIPFYDLKAGKVHRTLHPLKLLRLPWGFMQAFRYIISIRPALVLSFGGYLALPVALAAFLTGVPVVTHEQTVTAGWANRLIGLLAKKVFVSWKSSLKYFPPQRTIITGNPVRADIFKVVTPISFPESREHLPTIYVTGGKQGSHIINTVVRSALPELLTKFNVLHQAGHSTVSNDYERLIKYREGLPEDSKSGYLLKDYFCSAEIGAVFAKALFVISRSGANTITELVALTKPSILIPLPNTSGGEQEKNARMLESSGLALVLKQEELSPKHLIGVCDHLLDEIRNSTIPSPKITKPPFNPTAGYIIADEILKILAVTL